MNSFYIFVLLTFSSIAIAQAAGDRDLIIQKEMDCVDKHLQQNSGIGWNDVCDVPESSSQYQAQAVNQQMDLAEGNGAPQGIVQQNNPSDSPQFRTSGMVYEIAPEVSSITYREPALGVKESGVMYGINGIATYRPPVGNPLNSDIANMYRLEGRFDYGKVNYNGFSDNGDGTVTPYTFNGISDYMTELRGLIGKDYFLNHEAIDLTPYVGFGYRQLFDAFYIAKPGGYNRRIQYDYIPAGADVMTKLKNGWSLGANAEYDFFIAGNVQSYLGNIGLGNLTNTQKHGYGMRYSIKLVKNWDRFNFIFEPYIRYWHIHNSKVQESDPFSYGGQEYVLIGYEPDNNSTEIGGKFGIEF